MQKSLYLGFLNIFWQIFKYKKSEKTFTLLKIKTGFLFLTKKLVKILQKSQQFWVFQGTLNSKMF